MLLLAGCGHRDDPRRADAIARQRALRSAPAMIRQCDAAGAAIVRSDPAGNKAAVRQTAGAAERTCNQAIPILELAQAKDCVDFAQANVVFAKALLAYTDSHGAIEGARLDGLDKQRAVARADCGRALGHFGI
jgi:hypothetical protein